MTEVWVATVCGRILEVTYRGCDNSAWYCISPQWLDSREGGGS